MPLNSQPPIKPSITHRVRNTVLQTVGFFYNFIQPEIVLGVFLIFAVILGFTKSAVGFYIVFGVFIIGYFTERIIKIVKRKNAI